MLGLAQARADAEEAYGLKLQELAKNAVRKGGFHRDDGASARKAFDGMRKEMEEVCPSLLVRHLVRRMCVLTSWCRLAKIMLK